MACITEKEVLCIRFVCWLKCWTVGLFGYKFQIQHMIFEILHGIFFVLVSFSFGVSTLVIL
jgi:hypothetical protein